MESARELPSSSAGCCRWPWSLPSRLRNRQQSSEIQHRPFVWPALAVKIAIGVVLVIIAYRRRQKLGQPKQPKKVPKWQTGIDNMSMWFAIALGPLTQPWGLIAAGVATITEAKLSSWESSLALILFCLVATSAYLTMEIYVGFWPAKGHGAPWPVCALGWTTTQTK